MRLVLPSLVAILLAGCAVAPPVPGPVMPAAASRPAPAALYAALEGDFDNRVQYQAAPTALKRRPALDADWLDRQYARFVRVDAPLIGGAVFYLEWRSGGPGGPVSRQRIWSFREAGDGALWMDFYAFPDGKPYEGRGDEPRAFVALAPTALRGYGADCALRFEARAGGWEGETSADRCTIVAGSGRSMGINARVVLDATGGLSYAESGVLPDGRYAFKVPPTEPYRFERVRR